MRILSPNKLGTLSGASLRGLMLLLCCAIGLGSSLRSMLTGLDVSMRTPWSSAPSPTEETPAEETPAESSPVEELEVEEFTSSANPDACKRRQAAHRFPWMRVVHQVSTQIDARMGVPDALNNRNGCSAMLRC